MYILICEQEGHGITDVFLRDTREEAEELMRARYEEALDELDEESQSEWRAHDYCPVAGTAYVEEYAEFTIHECSY